MLVSKDLCEEKQMSLKFRKVKWKVLESFLRDGNPHLTDIVCRVLCLWCGYLFICGEVEWETRYNAHQNLKGVLENVSL